MYLNKIRYIPFNQRAIIPDPARARQQSSDLWIARAPGSPARTAQTAGCCISSSIPRVSHWLC